MSDLSMESVLGRPWLDESEKTEADQVFMADLYLNQTCSASVRPFISLQQHVQDEMYENLSLPPYTIESWGYMLLSYTLEMSTWPCQEADPALCSQHGLTQHLPTMCKVSPPKHCSICRRDFCGKASSKVAVLAHQQPSMFRFEHK